MRRALIFFILMGFGLPLFSQTLTHVLKEGETLYSLSKHYDIGLEALMRHNSIANPKNLKPGMILRIPRVYRVKKGDTLYSIAQKEGVPLDTLLKINGLKPGAVIAVHQSLILPGKAESAPYQEVSPARVAYSLPLNSQPQPTGDAFYSVGFFDREVPFKASAPGVVIYKNQYKGLGQLLLIQGPNSLVFGYSSFQSTPKKVGDTIKTGDVLGLTSKDTEYTLKYFIFNEETPWDPLTQKPR